MSNKTAFKDLFIYDMANNHQGNLEHGLSIINEISKVSNEENVRGAIKFQFRNLKTFIHPDFTDKKDIKHIPRFLSTALPEDAYQKMSEEIRKNDLLTMATPFDEESLELIKKFDIDIVKIASCSATDWPLIKAAVKTGKPVVLSTAGVNLNQIDEIVSFFEIEHVDFALMHCVAIYPTPINKLQLNQIDLFRKRYPNIPIGFSTHESPDYIDGIKIAYGKGARIFERHVGVETTNIKLNSYSSTPQQIKAWLQSYHHAVAACGVLRRAPASPEEVDSLTSLKRGVYAKENINKGTKLSRELIYFAMPLQDDQLESGDWRDFSIADRDYVKDQPVSKKVFQSLRSDDEIISKLIRQVKGMLNEARVPIGNDFTIELSHHYGLQRFREYGAVIIDCINRAYCKKLILQLPRQKHPYHFHKKKEETFQVLFGIMEVEIDGKRYVLKAGDSLVVHQNEWHKFQTSNGVIFEEISTTHYNNDSYYEDKFISNLPREFRKTKVNNWNNNMSGKAMIQQFPIKIADAKEFQLIETASTDNYHHQSKVV